MIKSMTGFGRGQSNDASYDFMVEIKSVNHRYLDLGIKMPRHISFMEDKIRQKISKNLSRGKVDVFVTFDDHSDNGKEVIIDHALAKAYVNSLKVLRDTYSLEDDIKVSLVAKFPDILKVEKSEVNEEQLSSLLEEAVDNALISLREMREKEGLKLREDIILKINYLKEMVKAISLRAPEVVKDYKVKLESRISELMDQKQVDEQRLAAEVAFFADRASIDEELVRLTSHMVQLEETLNYNQPVGRKLDFLVQEMNREINTIGSKANDLVITKNVVDFKSDLEKIREQIQNIE